MKIKMRVNRVVAQDVGDKDSTELSASSNKRSGEQLAGERVQNASFSGVFFDDFTGDLKKGDVVWVTVEKVAAGEEAEAEAPKTAENSESPGSLGPSQTKPL